MTRSNAREIAVHLLFAMDYNGQTPQELTDAWFDRDYYAGLVDETAVYTERPNQKQLDYIKSVLTGIAERREELDGYIAQYSVGWNFSRISRLAKCIMRVAMYESLYVDDVPTGVAINEAVELAKKYEEENTIPFINGILGSFSRRDPSAPAEAAEMACAAEAESEPEMACADNLPTVAQETEPAAEAEPAPEAEIVPESDPESAPAAVTESAQELEQ